MRGIRMRSTLREMESLEFLRKPLGSASTPDLRPLIFAHEV